MTTQSVPDSGGEEYRYSPVPGQYNLVLHGPPEKHRTARKTSLALSRAVHGVRLPGRPVRRRTRPARAINTAATSQPTLR
jgi:hypothetical protein